MEIAFNCNGNEKQLQCCEAWIDDTVTDLYYGGAKGGAKSYTGAKLIFGDALMYPDTRYFIARKKLNDLRKFTMPTVSKVFKDWGLDISQYAKFNGQDNYYECYNGSRVLFLEAAYMPSDQLYERFGSMEFTRGWIEEVGEFEEAARNNLAASIGRWKNDVYKLKRKILQTGNPSKNFTYRKYYIPFKERKLPKHVRFIQALPQDNKMLPDGYVDQLIEVLSPNQQERLLKGNWEYDDDPLALFDYNKIVELFSNNFIKRTGVKYLTCDIAYEGSDRFVICIWDGMVIEKVIPIDKIHESLVVQKIHETRLAYKVPIGNVVYDSDGVSKFVKGSKESGYLMGAVSFYNNGKVLGEEKYANLKAQCYFKLAELTNSNQIFIQDNEYAKEILEELEQIKKVESDDSKLQLLAKKYIKESLGRSPDFADSMMMRMYFELPRKPAGNIVKSSAHAAPRKNF